MDTDTSDPVTLPDGTVLQVRPVLPSDKAHFREGFARLSRESRYFRFLGDRKELSDSDLKYLTELDGYDHHAICCFLRHPDGREEGVGVARFVRMPEPPETAEVAITVVDSWQRRGVGSMLLTRLIRDAKERDIRVLRAEVHAGNEAIQKLLAKVAPATQVTRSGHVVILELEHC